MNCAKTKTKLIYAFAAVTFSSTSALADEITKLKDLKEKGGVVEIKVDDPTTATKGSRVCFFDGEDKKLGCGKVAKTTAQGTALARVTAKTFPKLEVGMKATIDLAAPPAAGADGAAADAKGGDAQTEKTTHFAISPISWLPFLYQSPVTYKSVAYAAPSSGTPVSSDLWASDKTVTNFFSLGISTNIPLGATKALNIGLRYRSNAEATVLSDYVSGDSSTYIELKEKASAMALWIDFVWKTIPVSQSFSLFLASGLDIENHTLTFGARQKSDTDGTDNSLASLTSKMTALSLRLRSGFDFKIAGPLAITSGLTVMAPITKFGATTSATVDDPHAADKTNSADNLKAAVAHKQALAIGLEIGANLVF